MAIFDSLAILDCEISEFVNSHTDLAVKLDLKCSCEKAFLCMLCVGNEEGSDCAGSAIFGILAIEFFLWV